MKNICWLHNCRFSFEEECPECLKLEKSYKESLFGESTVQIPQNTDYFYYGSHFLLWLNMVLWGFILFSIIFPSK